MATQAENGDYEELENRSVTFAVEHADIDNEVMFQMWSPRGRLTTYLPPDNLEALIAMLQRMQARQGGAGMSARLTWSRQPNETGLARVCQGQRGKDLKLLGCRIAYVRPFGRLRALESEAQWYWVAFDTAKGIPLRNTANEPCATMEEAQERCESYVRECLGLPPKKLR